MAEIIIEATDLCCLSGHQYLLKNINWQVKRGENWVVFGMNGSGKTTLLSTVAGFKKYTHGELKVFGQPFSKDNTLAMRQRIGWVSSSFFDHYFHKEPALSIVLSGKFGTLGIRGCLTNEDIKRAKDLLGEFHLAEKINQPFHKMSKGERQNVLIARALFLNPELLILDEPCTGLDILAREHLLNTVRRLSKNPEVTIIYVTHYTEEIMDIFPKSLLLSHGCSYAQGDTQDLFTGAVMSEFLGYPVEKLGLQNNHFLISRSTDRLGGETL